MTTVTDRERLDQYRLAMDTVRCYCLHAGYEWILTVVAEAIAFSQLCPQSHFFQRHCIVAHFIEDNDYDYVLFIGSDMGVINPERRIEEFIKKDKDLIFYNRIFSPEIMADSYIAKKSEFTIKFLHSWANFDYEKPKSFHGVDNVALHPLLLDIGGLNRRLCEELWNESRSYPDLFAFVICVRTQLDAHNGWMERIEVMDKGTAWARDGWLTGSKWSSNDFLLHGWQKWRENGTMFAGWISPFTSHDIDLSLCNGSRYKSNWKYKNDFVLPPDKVSALLQTQMANAAEKAIPWKAKADEFVKRKLSAKLR